VEIIIVSDGSTDQTCELVKNCGQQNVRLIALAQRQGKAVAINHGMEQAQGEIILYADVRQHFAADVISELVAHFADPTVCCVRGELILVKDAESQIQAEMGAYWKYEKWVRKMESRTGSVVGATGAIYAIRRPLFIPLPQDTILDDVLTPLNVVNQGYRCVFDSNAVAYDSFSKDTGQEWRRKVRTLAGNWQLLSLQPTLLWPWRNFCWWRFISHKIMRLLVPFALIIFFLSGALLPGVLYRTATGFQALFYGIALAGLFIPGIRTLRMTNLCYFFLVMNAAAATGCWLWLTGQSKTLWTPGKI
jgi:cellulose synthase/poly-beta-1,6-N-acetylglucosamine synthase-like glycosyltransferase